MPSVQDTILHASRSKALLRRRAPALYHLQLLSTPPLSRYGTAPRPVLAFVGTDAIEIPLCGLGIRRHARALSPADQRASGGRSLEGNAGGEAAFCATNSAATEEAGRTEII